MGGLKKQVEGAGKAEMKLMQVREKVKRKRTKSTRDNEDTAIARVRCPCYGH